MHLSILSLSILAGSLLRLSSHVVAAATGFSGRVGVAHRMLKTGPFSPITTSTTVFKQMTTSGGRPLIHVATTTRFRPSATIEAQASTQLPVSRITNHRRVSFATACAVRLAGKGLPVLGRKIWDYGMDRLLRLSRKLEAMRH